MQKAVEILLSLPRYSHLQGKFGNRRNPVATKLHYALAGIEDQILQDAEKELTKISGVAINTLMFDGAIIVANTEDKEEIEACLHVLGGKWKVTFSLEEW